MVEAQIVKGKRLTTETPRRATVKRIGIAAAMIAAFVFTAPARSADQPAHAPKHVASTSRTLTTKATVEAIDLDTRHVTLKTEEGKSVTIVADRRIKNLPQVHVGDVVQVTYREAIAVHILPGGAPPSAATEAATETAKPGAKPGGTSTTRLTIVATIEAIDEATQHVTLRGPQGNLVEVKVRDPANLKKVKVGDSVQITYTEAVAVAVRKPGA
jgi:Cu/Ag efflux protein CusF